MEDEYMGLYLGIPFYLAILTPFCLQTWKSLTQKVKVPTQKVNVANFIAKH